MRVRRKIGLRPTESEMVAKNKGERAWKMIYMVMVRLIAWDEAWKWVRRRGGSGK